jgi:L-amino acid N-acyltransferase YncA
MELASDAEVHNLASAAAHRAVGFEEVGVVRCFRKVLS